MAAEKKGKKDTKDKKGKKDKDAPAAGGGPSVAAHPRASRSVARARSWGALIGFMVGGYMSMPTHSASEALARAIVAGVVCYVVSWGGAVFVWRRLVILEIKGREQELVAAAGAAPAGTRKAA